MLLQRKKNSHLWKLLRTVSKKKSWYGLFAAAIFGLYCIQLSMKVFGKNIEQQELLFESYDRRLALNRESSSVDMLISNRERDQLIKSIENRLVRYLCDIPDCSYLKVLSNYLEVSPKLLNQIPSSVPLHNGDYYLSSKYGYRKHPISKTVKKHYGIDLAAPKDTPVYATSQGTVTSIEYSEKGYGNKIVIKHRFGFQTLYGHLNKILIDEGQAIDQHQLIGTVGNTGASTGYHLHYEILKNGNRVDPIPSLNLKYNVYIELLENNTAYLKQ
jgi:murein DD-endopeptidase MepM/ murein hydrolase activator NlpD